MGMKRIAYSATLLTMVAASTSASADTTPPKAGAYAANVLISEAVGQGCIDYEREQFSGVVDYGGITANSIQLRAPLILQTNSATGVYEQRLSIKTGAGSTQIAGKYVWTGRGVQGFQWDEKGTFFATIFEIDALSFVMQVTESYQPGCEEKYTIALTRIGSAK